ncbi:MAG TPA: integrase core domain-containing protein, partial [Solirubrobacteraceae bacterium]|nr:integrase core domain-containing protein [Solirubrobacteraceae bacterium]
MNEGNHKTRSPSDPVRLKTLAREWAYGQTYASSAARQAALPHWLEHYNTTRNHSAIGDRPPINR